MQVYKQQEKRLLGIAVYSRAKVINKCYQFTVDLFALSSAFALCYLLRFDFAIPGEAMSAAVRQLPLVVALQFALLLGTGVYSFIWRYISLSEMRVFMIAGAAAAVPLLLMRGWLPVSMQEWRVPVSIIFMDTVLGFGSVLGLRILRRVLYERNEKRRKSARHRPEARRRVLLIGAGRAGMLTSREIQGRGDMNIEIRGFVDDDSGKQGSVINQIKVLGTTEDIPRLVRLYDVDHVVITIAQASRRDFQRILKICKDIPIKVKIIPGLSEIIEGRVKVSRIRDVQIEDLLGREPITLDEPGIARYLQGKTVMVTGAGGSIGSELARQIARFQPSNLLLVERAEFALFSIDRELREKWPEARVTALVADVGDEARMNTVFKAYRPQVVLHAAAHKHVPIMEANTSEAVQNNVLATNQLGTLAGEMGVEVFVLISTDKAVRPTSVMGATKRAAELVVQDLDRRFETRYVAVRFGNVIGSAGSVIPIFRDQINRGGPVTVTHPDMVRYFMTIPEASQLVLQAGAMGKGGEIFILDMGEPVRIMDLAKETIVLSGLRPYMDIDIVFTGVRPGEKLFEELDANEEQLAKTRHPKIFVGKIAAYPEEKVQEALRWLTIFSQEGRDDQLRRLLNDFLPEATLKSEGETQKAIAAAGRVFA